MENMDKIEIVLENFEIQIGPKKDQFSTGQDENWETDENQHLSIEQLEQLTAQPMSLGDIHKLTTL